MKRNKCEETEADFRDKRSNFKTAANTKYSKYLVGLTHDFKTNPKRFWSFVKNAKSGSRNLSMLNVGGVDIIDDKEKANALNAAFASKFSDTLIAEFPEAPVYDMPQLTGMHCDIDTVRAILDSIPENKACGPDGISARIICECRDVLAVPLTQICSMSLGQGVFPVPWKRANVVPIFKKGSVRDPSCYRSVSLIPLFGKVLERVV